MYALETGQAVIDAASNSNGIKKMSHQSQVLLYADMKRKNISLPQNVQVSLEKTPNGGEFSVMFIDFGSNRCEIHECDANGNSIFRTYGEYNPSDTSQTNNTSVTPKKRKTRGMRLVFLLLTIFFGFGVFSIGVAAFEDKELLYGMITIAPLFALFLWLYLRKGNDDKSIIADVPAIPLPAPNPHGKSIGSLESSGTAEASSNKTILLVCDSVPARNFLWELLTKNGYKIIDEATTGAEAVEMYKKHKPALVIMDLPLPDIDGIQAMRSIIDFDYAAKVIICSEIEGAYEAAAEPAKQAGAIGFIVKPFRHVTLRDTVKAAINTETPVQIKHGNECCLLSYNTAHEAMMKRTLEEIEHFGGGDGEGYSWDDGSRKLCRCKNCGALFLNYSIRFLSMTYEQDEKSYSYYIPVASREQALEYNEKYIGSFGLSDSYMGKKIWFDGKKWCWDKQGIREHNEDRVAVPPVQQAHPIAYEDSHASSNSLKCTALEELRRVLPDECGWISGDTIIEYDGTSENSQNHRITFICTSYEYQPGYFNPWMHDALFAEHLGNMNFKKEGVYSGHKYEIKTEWMLPAVRSWDSWKQRIQICLSPEAETGEVNKDTFIRLAEFIEKYLVSRFDPNDEAVQKLKEKYEPVKIVKKHEEEDMDGHGRHTISRYLISVYGNDNQLIYNYNSAYEDVYDNIDSFVKSFNADVKVTSSHEYV